MSRREDIRALTVQLLQWIDDAPRSYDQVIDVWRTSCPRLSIWEDALSDGLVRWERGSAPVAALTERGRALLVAAG
jgi:hypothetical protein